MRARDMSRQLISVKGHIIDLPDNRSVFLGSDAELVARYSPVPVLLVPARGRR